MARRFFQLLLLLCLAATISFAADSSFVGKWKLNPEKSTLTDEMKVKSLGGNKYAFDFGGGNPVIIVADGTEQPGKDGFTNTLIADGPNSWKFVGKKDGRIRNTAIWTLSEDGNTLSDAFTVYQPNGSPLRLDYVYQRTAGTSGFAGTWDSTSEKVNSIYELQIQPYETDGLSFINVAEQSTRNMKFDGNDYPNHGPNLPASFVTSGRRVNERALELTDKLDGKVRDTQRVDISPDGKTLTVTVKLESRNKPNILVFDRE